MGRGVRELDPQRVVEPEDADAHEVGEVRGVADLLVELELAGRDAFLEATDAGRDVVGAWPPAAVRSRIASSCRPRSRMTPIAIASRIASPPMNSDDRPIHAASIAQAGLATVPCARPTLPD